MNATIKRWLAFPYFQLFGYKPDRVSLNTWNNQYRSGYWDYLSQTGHSAGLLTVFGYCQIMRPTTILDVGCGEGLLAEKLKVLPYEKLLGIDISSEAVAMATRVRGDHRTSFKVCAAHDFDSEQKFDAIIFNQCLYYMEDPLGIVKQYSRFLNPDGRMIVSLYQSGRNRTIWSLLSTEVGVEDVITVIQCSGRTTTKLIRPLGRS
jgi:2-polyprenyl-3-methyl-5-hydroxy-6-metoxy-1,4-benzoquinol methylase